MEGVGREESKRGGRLVILAPLSSLILCFCLFPSPLFPSSLPPSLSSLLSLSCPSTPSSPSPPLPPPLLLPPSSPSLSLTYDCTGAGGVRFRQPNEEAGGTGGDRQRGFVPRHGPIILYDRSAYRDGRWGDFIKRFKEVDKLVCVPTCSVRTQRDPADHVW